MTAMLINSASDTQPKHVTFATKDIVFEIPIEFANKSSTDGVTRPRKPRKAKGLKKRRRHHVPVILNWDIKDISTMRVSGEVYQKRTANNRLVPPATPTETSAMLNITITSRCNFYKAKTQSGTTYVLGKPCERLRHKVRLAEYFQSLARGYSARKQFRQLQAPRLAAALLVQAVARRTFAQRRCLEVKAEMAAAKAAAAQAAHKHKQLKSKKRTHELDPVHSSNSDKRQRTSEPPLLAWCLELKRRLLLPLCTPKEKKSLSKSGAHSHSFEALRTGLLSTTI